MSCICTEGWGWSIKIWLPLLLWILLDWKDRDWCYLCLVPFLQISPSAQPGPQQWSLKGQFSAVEPGNITVNKANRILAARTVLRCQVWGMILSPVVHGVCHVQVSLDMLLLRETRIWKNAVQRIALQSSDLYFSRKFQQPQSLCQNTNPKRCGSACLQWRNSSG